MSTHFRPDIEGLRALSILLVVVFHFAPALLPGGYVGVDVFFVTSGFLITQSLVALNAAHPTMRRALVTFWARRARRLLPNALLVLLCVGAVGALALPDGDLSRLGHEVSWAAGYAINWLYVLRAVDYLRWAESDASVLLNYWSLAVEEQFYLLWPGLLLLVLRWAKGNWRAPGWALALALLSLGYGLWLAQGSLTLAFFSLPARAWELLAGAALALLPRQAVGLQPRLASLAAVLGLLAVLGAALGLSARSAHPGWLTLLPVLGTVALLAGHTAAPNTALARALASAPLQWLGARSYSLYLWHWPVLMLGQALLPAQLPWVASSLPLLLLALAFLLAEAAFRGVESPARWRWGRGAASGRVLLLALAGSALLVLFGKGLVEVAERSLRPRNGPAPVAGANALPSLRMLQADLPVVYASGCHLGVPQTEPKPDCQLGAAPAAPGVLLFGDSHAAQWVPPLQRVAADKGQGLLAWTKSGCPSADVTVWLPATRSRYEACDRWREAVFQRQRELRVPLVIVANAIDDDLVLIDRGSGEPLRGAAAAAEFESGLVRTLARLRAEGSQVVLLRDTPRPRPDLLACLYGKAEARSCARPRAQALPARPVEQRALDAVAASGVQFWDLSDAICGAQDCPVFLPESGLAVYRDNNHLSASFAATLAGELARRWPTAAPPGAGR